MGGELRVSRSGPVGGCIGKRAAGPRGNHCRRGDVAEAPVPRCGAAQGRPESASMRLQSADVSLAICSDFSPASWIVTSDVPWDRLVTLGPAGFAAYARVRFIPDPTHQGQRESEADLDASPGEDEQWRALLQLLATETSDPSDCYSVSGKGGGFRSRLAGGPPSVFPAALGSQPAASFCFAGRSRRLRSGVSPQRLGSGAGRSSPRAARPRSCGRLTTRGASPQTSTHTGPG